MWPQVWLVWDGLTPSGRQLDVPWGHVNVPIPLPDCLGHTYLTHGSADWEERWVGIFHPSSSFKNKMTRKKRKAFIKL